MRRITLWVLSTLTTLVLLFSYHTSTGGSGTTLAAGTSVQAPAASGSDSGSADSGGSDPGSTDPGSTDSGATDSGATDSGATDSGSSAGATYTGDSVQTRWGPVQVRITVVDGKITASEAIVYPNGNHEDEQINSFALPVLNREAVDQQSADIDMVSGATVTSEGYLSSLQSAIDQAHL
ncbi:FMN-binding domain-containing protein [Pedococcus dokdonensis]|uniref:FMN-binding domain-containing protein n=1 Tax=Pedococcus dokdonensis TaxID=443156 RepID=A0A1H0M3S0_9MICO|nr:FMN-binding protein [Pedococcus dokdonensis]SDO74856.1 FMN-binding domain-containing protein [Pedococcus dokdonensis]